MEPDLRVVRGDPTPEEVAALLLALLPGEAAPARPTRSRWAAPRRLLRAWPGATATRWARGG